MEAIAETQGPKGPLATFLRELGPRLLKEYHPKAIVVFSAHFETQGEILVTAFEGENPLLMDYFGFPSELYQVEFKSQGDLKLSNRVVDLLQHGNIPARLMKPGETRGRDGRGFDGEGFDHGVFVPFRLMFGDAPTIPIVQVSIDMSLSPQAEWDLGKALAPLRSEGILIISGGLTIHTFEDFGAFSPSTAAIEYKLFEQAIVDAAAVPNPAARKEALVALTQHEHFKKAHPRAEHFVPLYIAAGAAEDEKVTLLSGIHGAKTFAFGG